jgi:transcriptional regulator with XRE-family HTH domain
MRMPPTPKRLKEARLRASLSQRKLGIAAGIDEFSASARINHYERGRHMPDFGMAERLSRVLRCPVAYFYAREEDLAEIILLAGRLSAKERRVLLGQLRRKAGGWHRQSGRRKFGRRSPQDPPIG